MNKKTNGLLRVDFVPHTDLAVNGRLGMTMMPGRIGSGSTGVHTRELAVDMEQLRRMDTRHLVSFMLPTEYAKNGPSLDESRRAARAEGLNFEHFPFVEGDTPPPESAERYVALVDRLLGWLREGANVVIHSRGGRGRCGLVAASVLVANGVPAENALRVVGETRPGCIDNLAQRKFVMAFEKQWKRARRELTNVVTAMLEGSDWKFNVKHANEVSLVTMGVNVENGSVEVMFVVHERRRQIQALVRLPIKVPAERREAAAAFLAQRNYDLGLGAFELDLSDGEVRFRADLLALNGPLSQESARFALAAGLVETDRVLPMLARVAFGEMNPGAAAKELAA